MRFFPCLILFGFLAAGSFSARAADSGSLIVQDTPGFSSSSLDVEVKRGQALYLGLQDGFSQDPPKSATCIMLVAVPPEFPKTGVNFHLQIRIFMGDKPAGKDAGYMIDWNLASPGMKIYGMTSGSSGDWLNPSLRALARLQFNGFNESDTSMQKPGQITLEGHKTLKRTLLLEVKDAKSISKNLPANPFAKIKMQTLHWPGETPGQ